VDVYWLIKGIGETIPKITEKTVLLLQLEVNNAVENLDLDRYF